MSTNKPKSLAMNIFSLDLIAKHKVMIVDFLHKEFIQFLKKKTKEEIIRKYVRRKYTFVC